MRMKTDREAVVVHCRNYLTRYCRVHRRRCEDRVVYTREVRYRGPKEERPIEKKVVVHKRLKWKKHIHCK